MSINWKGRNRKAREQANLTKSQRLKKEQRQQPCVRCNHIADAHVTKRGSRGQVKSRPCAGMKSMPTDDPDPTVFTVRPCACRDFVGRGDYCTCGHGYTLHVTDEPQKCDFTGCHCKDFNNAVRKFR